MQQITIDLTTIFTSAGTYSVTSQAHDSTGAFIDSDDSTAVSFKVAAAPSISVHPQNASYSVGGTATALSVTASVGDGGTLSYKWQISIDSVWTDIPYATNNTYTPSTATAGTYTYRCVVTNTLGATTARTNSNAATITVASMPKLIAPSISLDGSTLSITDEDGNATEFDIYVDGVKEATVQKA